MAPRNGDTCSISDVPSPGTTGLAQAQDPADGSAEAAAGAVPTDSPTAGRPTADATTAGDPAADGTTAGAPEADASTADASMQRDAPMQATSMQADAPTGAGATTAGAFAARGAPASAPDVPQPRDAPDPYGTPPYGQPGPWAPAPPVQHPATTPAHGTPIPPVPMVGAQAVPDQLPPPALGTQAPPVATAPLPPSGPAPGPEDRKPPVHHQNQAPHATRGGDVQLPPPTAPSRTPAHGTQLPAPAPQVISGAANSPHQSQSYDPWAASPVRTGGIISATRPGLPEPPRPASRRGSLLIGAVLLALVAGGIGGGIGAYIERNGGIAEVELPQAAAEPGDRDRDPQSVAGIAGAALPGVVTLHVEGAGRQGTGTGFVLDERGHILTNNHVVEPASRSGEISVTFSGGEVARGEIVGRDSGYDLAVVRVRGVSGLKPLPLGNSDAVRVGDPVVAIGAPFDLAGTVTTGIISAKERPITAGGDKGDGSDIAYVDALQTDAPINPGNSGGPLVDSKGRVIGINSAIRGADGGSGNLDGAQGGSIGLGFAIPVNQGKRVAEELINEGRAAHPVIGVTLDLEYAGDGARVRTERSGGTPVKRGGPGDRAGVEPGDVITEVDGDRVHSGEELIVKIRSHRPGDRLKLTLERDGGKRSLELTLGSASGG
ncbi:trypsin-like peptidase domain-containing protein [Streptomyces sp. NPDC051776]|uniref:S1C family serine protease n=1 Tax=Streptomyces sp. NPDC051776 TaxID=3155414 RepID=UPI00343D31ED